MHTLAAGMSFFDLEFQQMPRIIAAAVLDGPGGVAVIDPGPSSTLPVLRRELATKGLSLQDVNAILLTHIHLDHAGATGTLVRENPAIQVYVHATGAPHLVDPQKLLASAARLYGDAMDRLWGEFLAVPQSAVVPLSGGERVDVGGRGLEVAYTPGHASHHVSYFSKDAGVAFVGDTAGVRLQPGGYVVAPTPPPDIDVEAWHSSLRTIDEWRPDTLFLTHFGPSSPSALHLREVAEQLDRAAGLVKRSLAREGSDGDREAWFSDEIRRDLAQRSGAGEARAYEVAARFDLSWRGLARYWRKGAGSRR
jgi:glyoxylase-like metal-dependent hydrolase (beta-lactamase superfamily II)